VPEDAPRVIEDEKEVRKRRLDEKRELKMKFDSEYDEGGDGAGKSHYEELKKEVNQQAIVSLSSCERINQSISLCLL